MWQQLIMHGCDIVISSLNNVWPVSESGLCIQDVEACTKGLLGRPELQSWGQGRGAFLQEVECNTSNKMTWGFSNTHHFQVWKAEGNIFEEWVCLRRVWGYQRRRGCCIWPPWGKSLISKSYSAITFCVKVDFMGERVTVELARGTPHGRDKERWDEPGGDAMVYQNNQN